MCGLRRQPFGWSRSPRSGADPWPVHRTVSRTTRQLLPPHHYGNGRRVRSNTLYCRPGVPVGPHGHHDGAERVTWVADLSPALPVEVKGFEPSASTLRKYGSQPFDQVLSEDFPGGGAAIPSGSLTIPPLRSRQGHERSRPYRVRWWRRTDTHVQSAGSRSSQRMTLVPPWRRSRSSTSNRTSPSLKRLCLLPGRRRNEKRRFWHSSRSCIRTRTSQTRASPRPTEDETAATHRHVQTVQAGEMAKPALRARRILS